LKDFFTNHDNIIADRVGITSDYAKIVQYYTEIISDHDKMISDYVGIILDYTEVIADHAKIILGQRKLIQGCSNAILARERTCLGTTSKTPPSGLLTSPAGFLPIYWNQELIKGISENCWAIVALIYQKPMGLFAYGSWSFHFHNKSTRLGLTIQKI